MKKKAILAGLVLLSSLNVMADLPDEINYSPYYQDYTDIRSDRDFTEESLGSNRTLLTDILESLQAKRNYISLLQNQISDYQIEIRDLDRELPGRQQELRSTENQIRNVQAEISRLQNRQQNINRNIQKQRQSLSPIQNELKKKQKLIRDVQTRLQATLTKLKNKRSKIVSNDKKIESNKVLISSLKSQIQNLEASKVTLKTKISEITAEIKKIELLISTQTTKVNKLTTTHKELKQKLNLEKRKLQQLVSSNADAEKIKAQKAVVNKIAAKVKNVDANLKTLRAKLVSNQKSLGPKKTSLQTVKKNLAAIPSKIQTQNKKIESTKKENQAVMSSTKVLKTEVSKLTSVKHDLESKRSGLEKRITALSTQQNTIKEEIKTLTGKLHNVERNLSSSETQRVGLNNRANELARRIDQINSRIPQLERSVASNDSEISSTRADIRQLKNNENIARRDISRLEVELVELNNRTDNAYAEYQQRHNLYLSYKAEAEDLGAGQTSPAINLGESTGTSLAESISNNTSSSVADDFGKTQAILIGFVRGEISGYKEGYATGYSDSGSISLATSEATGDGTESAYSYASTHFAPVYFEEFIQEKLTQDVKIISFKSFENTFVETPFSMHKGIHSVDDLSNSELQESIRLKTSMDTKIIQAQRNEQRVDQLLSDMRRPGNTYIAPQSIPYQSVNCSNVYKGLTHFKEICSSYYEEVFQDKYLASSSETFSNLYTDLFDEKFSQKEPVVRENNYDAQFNSSSAVAFAEAKVVGKKHIYDETYSIVYDKTYDQQLPIAKDFSKREAKVDVVNWISANPVITVENSLYSSGELRGGDKGTLYINLKNISPKATQNAAVVKVVEAKHLVLEKGQYIFSSVDGKTVKKFAIPFTVSTAAGSSDKINFKADVTLPGDKYKSARVESINISKGLILNPKASSENKYSKSPNIKKLFKYLIHTFQVDIAPSVENIKEGYDISLTPVGEHAKKVNMKISKVKTKRLSKGQVASVKLKYSFQKTAKKKRVEFDLLIKYKDIVIKQERISLVPR